MISLIFVISLCSVLQIAGGCTFGQQAGCVYACHCESGECDANNGTCSGGCDDGDMGSTTETRYRGAWQGYGCQLGNVALGRSARQGPREWGGNVAMNAVDGNNNNDLDAGSCAHPDGEPGSQAWWQVDLGELYVVVFVTITNRDQQQFRLVNTGVDVSETSATYGSCGVIGQNGLDPVVNVTCSTPLKARYVRLQRLTSAAPTTMPHQLNFCEVQVYAYPYKPCPAGTWGVACGARCHCVACDELTGACADSCSAGYIKLDGDCQTPCGAGSWGVDCRLQCHCRDSAPCHVESGYCSKSCDDLHVGDGCQTELPRLTSAPIIQSASVASLIFSFDRWKIGNGDQPTHYSIWYRVVGGQWQQGLGGVFKNPGIYTQTGLQPGMTYELKIVPILVLEGQPYSGDASPPSQPYTTLSLAESLVPTPHPTEKTGSAPSAEGTAGADMGVIGGAVAAVLLVVIVVAVAVVLFVCRRKGKLKNCLASLPSRKRELITEEKSDTWQGHLNPAFTELESGDHGGPVNNHGGPVNNHGGPVHKFVQQENKGGKPANSPVLKRMKPQDSAAGAYSDDDGNKSDFYSEDEDADAGAGHYENIYSNDVPLTKVIKVQDLKEKLDSMAETQDSFKNEFMMLPKTLTAKVDVASHVKNKTKNRFNNILAYDHTRVVLDTELMGEGATDYINASYIPAYKDIEKGYIAAQGPKKSTVEDMWHMVWQTGANRVVMVTNMVEMGKSKCEQYWPEADAMELTHYVITLVREDVFAEYTLRLVTLLDLTSATSRSVHHCHFTGWPDHGVPQVATSLLEFRRCVRDLDAAATGPLIVHCSAGIGRTGTYMAVDYLLDQARHEQHIDLFRYTARLRANRVNMIQTLDQYRFVYYALLEGVRCGNTALPCAQASVLYASLTRVSPDSGKSRLHEQYELLESFKAPRPDSEKCVALAAANLDKNRDSAIVPRNRARPYLTTPMDGSNDYINAACVDGYRARRAYTVTQAPLPTTVGDIWRLLYDHRSPTLVLLHHITGDDETMPVFWPSSTAEPLRLLPLTISLLEEEELGDGLTMRYFNIHSAHDPENDWRVRQFEMSRWTATDECPVDVDSDALLALFTVVTRWQQRSGDHPVTVMCRTGACHCGVYLAASYLLEKLQIDQQLNVFLAVKQVRLARPQLLNSLDQYKFLHELALLYMQQNDTYSNFM